MIRARIRLFRANLKYLLRDPYDLYERACLVAEIESAAAALAKAKAVQS